MIFDLFHTLTSLETTPGDSLPTTYETLGVDKDLWRDQLWKNSDDRLKGKLQDPFEIVASMAHAIDPEISNELVSEAVHNRIHNFEDALLHVPRGVVCVLRTLRALGKKIGLVSNADAMEAAAWERSPIAPLFDSVVFSCEVGLVKPQREIYELSLRRLGVTAETALFVGDGGSNELIGAKDIGLTTVMITGIVSELWPEKIPERRRHADYVIEKLAELVPDPGDAF